MVLDLSRSSKPTSTKLSKGLYYVVHIRKQKEPLSIYVILSTQLQLYLKLEPTPFKHVTMQ